MENPDTKQRALHDMFNEFLAKHQWTVVGLFTALAVVALFFVLSGVGQPQVLAFSSVLLDNPTFAVSNDQGTVILDTSKTRLVFVNENHELRKIVQVDGGELPIHEVSHVQLAKDCVLVAGATRSNDGETIATESILAFDYNGTMITTMWEVDYIDRDKEKEDAKAQENGEYGTVRSLVKEGHFEPTILDLQPPEDGSSALEEFFFVRSVGYATAKTGAEIHHVSIKEDGTYEDNLLGEPLADSNECLHETCYLSGVRRCVLLGDWGSLLVADVTVKGNDSEQSGTNDGFILHTASNTERYATLDASGDSIVAYDCVGSKLVRFDNVSSDKPQRSVLDDNVEVESISLEGSMATVVLKSDEIRRYDTTNGTYENMVQIYPEPPLRVHALILEASWAYLIGLAVVLVFRYVGNAVREGKHTELRRAIISFAAAAIFVGFLLNSFVNKFADDVVKTSTQLAHASAIVGYTSPKTIGDVAKREAETLEAGKQEVALEDDVAVREFLEEFSSSSYLNGAGMQSFIYGVSSDGSHVWNLGASERTATLGSELADQEVRDNVLAAVQDASSYTNYRDVNQVGLAISLNNPVRQSLVNSNDGYLFTCFVPIVASDGSCRAVLEVSQRFGSFWNRQSDRLIENIFTLVLLAIGFYYASNELMESGQAFLRYRELRQEEVDWAGGVLARPIKFIMTLAKSVDAALAVVLARDMLSSQGVDSNAFLWSLPALAITAGDLLGTIINGRFAGRMEGRPLALAMTGLGIGAQIMCLVAVVLNSFWLFVVGKLIAGIGYTVADSMTFSLAFQAEGEDRGKALEGLKAATPAGILAGVLGGILSSAGAIWLYVASAAFGVIVFLLYRITLPAGKVLVEVNQDLGAKQLVRFVFSKKMIIMAILVMIPVTLAGGYRKFVFPLLLDSSGMSKQQIANIFVIADVVMYMASGALRTYKKTRDSWKLTWRAMLVLGLVFMLFSLNQSPMLAILVVLIASVLSSLAKAYKRTVAEWSKADYGYDKFRTNAALHVEDTAIKNVRAPVLGALQLLGGAPCCVILGGIISISGALYAFVTRRYRVQPTNQTPSTLEQTNPQPTQ